MLVRSGKGKFKNFKESFEAQREYFKKQKIAEILDYYNIHGLSCPLPVLLFVELWSKTEWDKSTDEELKVRSFLKEKYYSNCGAKWTDNKPGSQAFVRIGALIDATGKIHSYRIQSQQADGTQQYRRMLPAEAVSSPFELLDQLNLGSGYKTHISYFELHTPLEDKELLARKARQREAYKKMISSKEYLFAQIKERCLSLGMTEETIEELTKIACTEKIMSTLRAAADMIEEKGYTIKRVLGIFRKLPATPPNIIRNYVALLEGNPSVPTVKEVIAKALSPNYIRMILPGIIFIGHFTEMVKAMSAYVDREEKKLGGEKSKWFINKPVRLDQTHLNEKLKKIKESLEKTILAG